MLFSLERAATLAELTPRAVRAWIQLGLVRPEHSDVAMFCFRDVVALKTLAILRSKYDVPVGGKRGLRAFSVWLHARFHQPWSSLRFSVAGREIFFEQEGDFVSNYPPGQLTIGNASFGLKRIEASLVAAVRKLDRRTEDPAIDVRAGTVKGTRVRTKSVFALHESGMSARQIVREFPSLREVDVHAAVAFERQRQRRVA